MKDRGERCGRKCEIKIRGMIEREVKREFICLFVGLVGFLTSSSATRLYRGRVPRLTSDKFTTERGVMRKRMR